ncbi:MAG: GDP-mannose 4,6-dehydratase [Candidatus Sabulitectum sp.]|nr:GDP-mannose 4,6-dehydratase [Candidatus Sabulitectum sp.]
MSRQIGDFSLDDGPVLVTGAGGFAGGRLMELFQLGQGDIASDITSDFYAPAGVRRIAWELPHDPPVSLGDVRYVVHLAGLSSVAHTRSSVEKVMKVNAEGTLKVARWAARYSPDATLLFASSAEVYRPSAETLAETSPLGPRSPYGESKLRAENLLADSGVEHVIARSFPHYGSGQSGHFVLPSFCQRVIASVRNGTDEISTGNLQAVRDYLYIDDVVLAYACLLANGRSGGIYNVCSGTGHSIGDLLSLIVKISGSGTQGVTDHRLLRENDQFCQIGDPGKLRALGWTVKVPLEEGLKMLYQWWEERL